MQQVYSKKVLGIGLLLLSFVVYLAITSFARPLGSAVPPDEPDAQAASHFATPVELIVLESETEILVQRQFLGRIEARQSAKIGFEFGGTIDQIFVEEGGRVMRDQNLASLRTDARAFQKAALQENRTAVRAQLTAAERQLTKVTRDINRGMATTSQGRSIKSERDALASRLIELDVELEQLALQIGNSIVYAPFNGIIGAVGANSGETVAAGQSIVSIFESGGAHLRVGLPTSLNPEELLDPRVEVNGKTYNVTFKSVRPDIDFRTNTRVALFTVEAQDLNSFGLSATLKGDVSVPVEGAWVPVEAMRPSSEGYWIVLAVNDDMVAERVAIEVQYLKGDQAYVIGAFQTGTKIIGSGAHKVVPGQAVRVE